MTEENKIFCVYKITNKKNGKVYIGESGNVRTRWKCHLSAAKSIHRKDRKLIHKAIAKYGKDNFLFEIIEEYDTEIKALEREIFWISVLKTNIYRYGDDAGYNQTDGGEGTSGIKFSDERRKELSKRYAGEKGPFFGRKHTPENRKILSDAAKLRVGPLNPFFGKTQDSKTVDTYRGENNNQSKLTEKQALDMLNDYYTGNFSEMDLSKKYPITRATVHKILVGIRWKHIPRDIERINQIKFLNKGNKFTEEQVMTIYKDLRKSPQIAKEYKVDEETIRRIKNGKTWSHLTGHIKNVNIFAYLLEV
jgi:group I intron endonuclease